MRAVNKGDLVFLDHVDISVDGQVYVVPIVVDAASNLLAAYAQKDKKFTSTQEAIKQCFFDWNLHFKAVCADSYFHEEPDWPKFWAFYNVKQIPLGPNTPWPNPVSYTHLTLPTICSV